MITIADGIAGIREGATYGKRIAGKQFSIGRYANGQRRYAVVMQCACGRYSVVCDLPSIKKGRATQCRHCHNKENSQNQRRVHGDCVKNAPLFRLYRIWNAMRNRCGNKNVACYKYYGGKGVSVCAEWLDYGTFRRWALSSGYAHSLTIDRIDSSKNYQPDNCQWISHSENVGKTKRGKRRVLGRYV